MERMSESMKGDFVGIGVSFYPENDTIVVINAIKGGPSDKAGILGGDRIVSANGKGLTGKNVTSDSLVGSLKGKINTTVDLEVKRPGKTALLKMKVTRDVVPIISIDASYMLTDKLGYVKINRFAETTPTEFKDALQQLKRDGATKIVLDLRDNPGGYISAAEQVVDEFLKEDRLILFTKTKPEISKTPLRQTAGSSRMQKCLYWSMKILPLPVRLWPAPCRTTIKVLL